MASEIRVNRLSNRSGLSTITFANGGVQFSGITTFANGEFYVGTGATIINPGTNEFNFHTGGSNRFTINNSGANLGTGNITAVDATFTGNVSIGKTLTYEDVKNVDSVGVVTARTGVKVTGGDFTVGTAITASSVTGNVTQDVGITTFSGSATWFKGLTANKDMYWSKSSGSLIFKDTAAAIFGNSSDLQISHDATDSKIVTSTGDMWLQSTADDVIVRAADNISLQVQGGEYGVEIAGNGAVNLYYDNSAKLATTSSGVSVTGGITATGDVLFDNGTNANKDILFDASANKLEFSDGVEISLGNGSDLRLYHNGSNSYITSITGNLVIDNSSGVDMYINSGNDIYIRPQGTENGIKLIGDGAVELYHNSSKKFETTSSGIEIFGQIQMDDGNILRLGNDGDMQLYHTGSHSHVSDRGGAGNLQIESNNAVTIKQNDNESYCAKFFIGAASELYHNNVFTITTTSTGVRIPDSKALELGNRNSGGVQGDLRLYHDGSNSYIDEIGSGNLYIRNNTENAIFCQTDGFVKLYYDGSQRLETTSAGVLVSGSLTADGGNAITLGDDKKIVLGTGSDFQMWHDSSNNKTIFKENGSGSFDIRGNTIQLQDAGGNENLAIFTPNGGCTFKYDNSTKLITESTGINVTGRTTWTGGTDAATQSVYLSAASNNPTQIGMFNGYGAKQGFCFYNNGSSSYTSWGIITDQQNIYFRTASYNIGNESDLSSNWTSRLEIGNNGITTVNPGGGLYVRGGTSNRSQDTVVWIDKQNNNDWCLKVEPGTGSSTDYGVYVRANNSASYGFALHNLSAWKFRVAGNGTIYSSNTSVQSISDVRLKDNIVDANSQWDDIKGLRFRNFKWKDDSGHADGITYLGLIAQEVEPISPNLVEIDAQDKEDKENGVPDPEYKNVKYSIVWMKAVKALQEAQARIETLEAEVAALKSS